MQTAEKTIDHGTLRSLVDAGAAVGAEVVGAAGGWGVVIRHGRTRQTLSVQRGQPRTFRKFETLAGYLKELGITDLRVHTAEFAPARNDKPGDRRSELAAERMRAAHAAAAHDKWFREQIGLALDDARSPEAAPSIPHAVAKANMAKQRAELLSRVAKVK